MARPAGFSFILGGVMLFLGAGALAAYLIAWGHREERAPAHPNAPTGPDPAGTRKAAEFVRAPPACDPEHDGARTTLAPRVQAQEDSDLGWLEQLLQRRATSEDFERLRTGVLRARDEGTVLRALSILSNAVDAKLRLMSAYHLAWAYGIARNAGYPVDDVLLKASRDPEVRIRRGVVGSLGGYDTSAVRRILLERREDQAEDWMSPSAHESVADEVRKTMQALFNEKAPDLLAAAAASSDGGERWIAASPNSIPPYSMGTVVTKGQADIPAPQVGSDYIIRVKIRAIRPVAVSGYSELTDCIDFTVSVQDKEGFILGEFGSECLPVYSPFRYDSQGVSVVIHFRAISDDSVRFWVVAEGH